MNIIDQFILYHFRKSDRKSILNILLEKHSVLSKNWILNYCYRTLIKFSTNKGLFTLIYNKNLWGEYESVSGPGSSYKSTENIRKTLPKIFKKYDISSVLDIPCGDFNWMQSVEMYGIKYTGADIVSEIIKINKKKFANDQYHFLVLNMIKDPLPQSDLIICRDGLVHLSNKEIKKSLKNFKKSGSKYLLMTSFIHEEPNQDIGDDYWHPINFQRQPFNLPEPILCILEDESLNSTIDKNLCLWKIDDIN